MLVMCTRFLCGLAFGLAIHKENATLKEMNVDTTPPKLKEKLHFERYRRSSHGATVFPFFFSSARLCPVAFEFNVSSPSGPSTTS